MYSRQNSYFSFHVHWVYEMFRLDVTYHRLRPFLTAYDNTRIAMMMMMMMNKNIFVYLKKTTRTDIYRVGEEICITL